jgi:hypothetical protein
VKFDKNGLTRRVADLTVKGFFSGKSGTWERDLVIQTERLRDKNSIPWALGCSWYSFPSDQNSR